MKLHNSTNFLYFLRNRNSKVN
uniref:Uncharacterized protein n=1 Tax=Rhizophora mucronata TaxID=61149 RepID=A0A2P2R327_RHIMU